MVKLPPPKPGEPGHWLEGAKGCLMFPVAVGFIWLLALSPYWALGLVLEAIEVIRERLR